MGSARARKTGMIRYAGVVRRGRKWRRRRRTKVEMKTMAKRANASEPTEDFIVTPPGKMGQHRKTSDEEEEHSALVIADEMTHVGWTESRKTGNIYLTLHHSMQLLDCDYFQICST